MISLEARAHGGFRRTLVGLKSAEREGDRSGLRGFRRTLVGLKFVYVGADSLREVRQSVRGFRRTLVGLKSSRERSRERRIAVSDAPLWG